MPDIAGAKVRFGVVWFAAAASAAAWSRPALGALMAVAAAAATDEVTRTHLGARRWPIAVAGAVLPLAALGGSRGLLAGAAGVCGLVALSRLLLKSPVRAIEELAVGITAALAVGLAAASPVLVSRLGPAAAVTMVVLVSAYEVGDFLVGTGASTPWEGPMAGIVAVAVCAFAAWVLDVAPLDQDGVVVLAAAVALLAPIGPPLGSVLLGSASRPGRYVRRLDTLLVAGPVAAWLVAEHLRAI
ncbi:MAG: hypothetical protein AB7H43_13535 [Acidimicrobiia bacterium]